MPIVFIAIPIASESGAKRREKGLARAGNARVRRGMVQLAWRFLWFQKESALARWYQARTADSRAGTRHGVKLLTLHPPSLGDRHRDLISVRRAVDAKMVA